MEEYPSNSREAPKPPRQESDRPASVVTGRVIVKKPSLGKRFKDAFTGDDGRTVMTHVLWDVAIPSLKDLLRDAAHETVDRALYGESRGRSTRPTNYSSISSTLASRVNYSRPSFMTDPRDRQPQQTKTTRGSVSIDDIVLEHRHEADEVIARMNDLISRFGMARIADLFDLVGKTGEYTDEKFGWLSMDGARPHRVRDGFMLDLPRPVQLD